MFFYLTIYPKKAIFFEKNDKNCFGGACDHFLGKEDTLPQKLT